MMADGVTPDGEAVEMIDRTDADGPYVVCHLEEVVMEGLLTNEV